ncbi:MAG TPA: DUF2059 domain-containing protein [Allosphingosinicella sp.]|jgi:hypothetical protein
MRAAFLFFAAAAAALAAPAWSQGPAAVPASPAQEFSAEALALARLAEPAGDSTAAAMASAKKAFLKLLEEDADSASLEEEYPGISEAVWAAMEPVMRESIEADTPELWERLARLYTQRLTPQEIAGLSRFHASPAGRKMARTMQEKSDFTPIMEAAIASPEGEISAEAMVRAQAPGRAAAIRSITADDEGALKQLSQSISLPKLYALSAEVQRVTVEWMNEPDPALDARLEKVVEDRITRFMAEADTKK